MNKTTIDKKLKGLFNNTTEVAGFKVARVCWDQHHSWKIIHKDKSFDDVTEERETDEPIFEGSDIMTREHVYEPIKEFYYKKDLVEYITKNQS